MGQALRRISFYLTSEIEMANDFHLTSRIIHIDCPEDSEMVSKLNSKQEID